MRKSGINVEGVVKWRVLNAGFRCIVKPTLLLQPSGPPQPDVSQSPFGLGSMGGLPGISGMGMGSANFMEMQQRMQREVCTFDLLPQNCMTITGNSNLRDFKGFCESKHNFFFITMLSTSNACNYELFMCL